MTLRKVNAIAAESHVGTAVGNFDFLLPQSLQREAGVRRQADAAGTTVDQKFAKRITGISRPGRVEFADGVTRMGANVQRTTRREIPLYVLANF